MAKQGEIEYLARAGAEGTTHAEGKPFTDTGCGPLLADMSGILSFLPPPPARILDLGCGSGWTSVLLGRRGYEVVGQDIAPDLIALAQRNREAAGLANVSFVVGDYEGLAFADEFDAAVFYDSLHHAVEPQSAMAAPGGRCVPAASWSRSSPAMATRARRTRSPPWRPLA